MNLQLSGTFRFSLALLLAIIILVPIFSGCSKKSSDIGKVVVTVNNDPVKLEDFQREIALRSRQDPSYRVNDKAIENQLNTIIDRRLMIQEATRMGLVNNEDFVRTIQTFWEQTLIRELIEEKNQEWEKRLFITEEEINEYYEKMRYKFTFQIARSKDKIEAQQMLEKIKSGNALKWETIGPVNYFDNAFGIFKSAFHMSEGETGILKDETGYFVYLLERKEAVDLPPLEKLYSQIKTEMFEKKKTEALDEWLKGIREKANIRIDRKMIDSYLNSVGHNGSSGGEGAK